MQGFMVSSSMDRHLMLICSYVDYEAAACGGDNRSNSEANKAG